MQRPGMPNPRRAYVPPVRAARSCRAVPIATVLLLSVGLAPAVRAQGAASATLRGTVLDTSGGVLPGAAVTLVNTRTTASRSTTTGAAGTYVFPAVLAGDYRLEVRLAGLRNWESGEVHLSPGDSLEVEAKLQVGGQTAQVEVTPAREMVRTDQGAREGLITSQQIQNLSIISRGAMELLKILPGTVTPDQSTMETVGFTSGSNNFRGQSVNGSRGTNISPVLDGSKIVDIGMNETVMLNMNPDMVEEVKIQTSNYAAEYGSPHVQVTAVTKGGSSRFHGSVYDYLRNWRLNANDRSNNYAAIERPKNSYQYPGFNLSGPLLVPGTDFNKSRERVFFFVGYEYQHQVVDPGTTLSVVPTLAQRQGDLSELLENRGQNLAQPTIVTIPAGFPGAGQPAPNNDLRPYMDPLGQAFLNLYPQPNHTDPGNRYNYAFNTPLPASRWQLTSRLDWNVSEQTHAYVRLALEREQQKWSNGVWASAGMQLPSRVIGKNRAWSVAASVTSVLSPSLTNEVIFSASQLTLDNDWEDPAKMQLSALGLQGYQGIFPSDNPYASISLASFGQGLGHLWGSTSGGMPIYAHTDSVSVVDTLSKVLRAHTIKLGVFVERARKQQNFNTNEGMLIMGSPWTPGATGNDYGDLLVGRLGEFVQGTQVPGGEYRFWNYEGYLQDSWKARRNLTLEAGVRIAKMPNNEELNGLGMLFEPSTYDPTQGAYIDRDPRRPNGVLLASRGEIPKGMTRSPGLAVMPRFNFAWDVRSDGGLVLRGGAGLFYNRPQGNYQYVGQTMPPNVYNVDTYFWDVPGGLTLASLPAIDPWSHLGTSYVDSLDPSSIHLPRTWTWSLGVAKRLPAQQTLEIAYVGNRGDHLPDRTPSVYVPPGALSGTYGNADLDNPLHRAALDSSVVAALRNYPAYGNSWWYQYEAWSNYHALQVSLTRQAGRRAQYFLNYTFSKALGITGDDTAVIDPLDPGERSYGILPQDRTHIFNASYNLLLPDPIRTDGNAFLRHVLNGWQISGITRYASGAPFRVVFSGELAFPPAGLAWYGTGAHGSGDRTGNSGPMTPVFTGDPRLGDANVGEKILDVNQIGIPALGESGPFQQPYSFRVPTRWNFDLSVFKSFALGGSRRLQLRMGVFNLFNQAAPTLDDIDLDLRTDCNVRVDGVPNGAGGYAYGVCDPTQGYHMTDLTQENFGKIKTKHGHRVIELAARFDF